MGVRDEDNDHGYSVCGRETFRLCHVPRGGGVKRGTRR
jgi:hypothetical protein